MNLSSFDLNLLRVLDALLREGSTVRAAERIGLSQPAVSAALGRLRHALGDPLFVRRGQGMVPTDFARDLELPLRAALDEIEALLTGPGDFDPATAELTFRLTGTDFFADLLMPRLANRMSREAPGLRLQQVDLVPDNYVERLDTYEVDIALLPTMEFPDWVDNQPVHWSSFVTISRRDHPRLLRAGLRPGDTVPVDLFCDLGHVVMSPEGKLTARGDDALARVGRKRRVVMTMPFFSGVCRAVAQSDLVSLIPQQLAHGLADELGLRIYAAPMPVPPVLLVMAWHKRSTNNPAHRWLRGIIAELLLDLNRDEAPLPA